MKLTAPAFILFILLLPNVYRVNGQTLPSRPEPNQVPKDILELEAKLKELDKYPPGITVKVKGDKKSPDKANIKFEMETVAVSTGSDEPTKTTLLNIDFSKIHVPDEYIKAKIIAAFSNPGRGGECPGVKVMQLGASADYQVVEDYTYKFGGHVITAWEGFKYDRASVPRLFWVLIDKDSLSNVAPLFHDLLYRHGGKLPNDRVSPYRKFSRKQTDNLFLELMTKCGVGYLRRMAAYEAVRKFSGFAWKD